MPIPEFNREFSINHDECLVRIDMGMADEFTLNYSEFKLVISHFSDHFWVPDIGEEFELVSNIYGMGCHYLTVAAAVVNGTGFCIAQMAGQRSSVNSFTL